MAKFNNETLHPGEQFFYSGISFICLDVVGGNYLAMTSAPYRELPFDTENCNDWRKSSLRGTLNTEFLRLLDKKHLVRQVSNLVADNGDKSYGTCEDYVTILSYDQYRKYRDIVPLFDEWMWTLTPWTCSAGHGYRVRYVNSFGNLHYYYAVDRIGVAPVCLFSSENLTLHRQTTLEGGIEHDKPENG